MKQQIDDDKLREPNKMSSKNERKIRSMYSITLTKKSLQNKGTQRFTQDMKTIAKFDHGRNHHGSTIFKRSFGDQIILSKNRSTQVLSLDNNQSTPSQNRTIRGDASAQECYGTVNMLSEGASSTSESCHVMFLHEQTGQFQPSNSGTPSQVSQHQTVCSPTGSLRSISESIARTSPRQITNANID